MSTAIAEYSESNRSGITSVLDVTQINGETFTAISSLVLDKAAFFLKKGTLATGTLVARIYAMTGAYGTTGVPTGVALATSDTVNVSVITSAFSLINFPFSGHNQILLQSGTNYCLALDPVGVTFNGGSISVGLDITSPTYSGNSFAFSGGSYSANASWDYVFYVYGVTSRLAKVVAWENRVQPFTITSCTRCGRPIEKNPYTYLYCGKCRAPVSAPTLLSKLPKPIEPPRRTEAYLRAMQPQVPKNPNPPKIVYVSFTKKPKK